MADCASYRHFGIEGRIPRSDSKFLRSLRSVLDVPTIYNLWWRSVGGPGVVKVLVAEHVQAGVGARILEIGCGPGTILDYLPDCEYVGFDISPRYVEMARKRFPRAQFICESVSRFSLEKPQQFDAVLAFGVVHHLDDQAATRLFQIAHDALKSGGKLVTFDGVFTADQSPIARWLLARDRGEYVRSEPEYLKVASKVFGNIKPTIRHDLLHIPYTHLILECIR